MAVTVPRGIEMRLATEQDGAFLRLLYRDVHAPEFQALALPPSALDSLLDMQFRAQRTGYGARYPRSADHLVLLRGDPVGRLLLDSTPAALHLVDIALLLSARRRGIGHHLLTWVGEQADLLRLPVQLHVRVDNPAVHFYQRHGFVLSGGEGMDLTMQRAARSS